MGSAVCCLAPITLTARRTRRPRADPPSAPSSHLWVVGGEKVRSACGERPRTHPPKAAGQKSATGNLGGLLCNARAPAAADDDAGGGRSPAERRADGTPAEPAAREGPPPAGLKLERLID
eukprot:4587187-Prymnesium_polylepis.1